MDDQTQANSQEPTYYCEWCGKECYSPSGGPCPRCGHKLISLDAGGIIAFSLRTLIKAMEADREVGVWTEDGQN